MAERRNIGLAASPWLRPPPKLEKACLEAFRELAAQVRKWLKDPPSNWQRIDHNVWLEIPRPWYPYAHFRWTPTGLKTLVAGIGALHSLGLWGILEKGQQAREAWHQGHDPRTALKKVPPP
jgi:hypothetical protein